MIRRLKTLAVALVAVFAMSAMVASAASAHAVFTSSDNTTTNISSEGENHMFAVTGLTVTCKISDFKGHMSGIYVTSITVTPIYTECHGTGGPFKVAATVTGFGHNGDGGTCDYVIHATGTVDLNCASGEVTIDAGTCTIHIPPQTGLEKATFRNMGSSAVEVTFEITSIKASHTDGFGCPFAGNGSGAIGTLGGSSSVGGHPANFTHDPS